MGFTYLGYFKFLTHILNLFFNIANECLYVGFFIIRCCDLHAFYIMRDEGFKFVNCKEIYKTLLMSLNLTVFYIQLLDNFVIQIPKWPYKRKDVTNVGSTVLILVQQSFFKRKSKVLQLTKFPHI